MNTYNQASPLGTGLFCDITCRNNGSVDPRKPCLSSSDSLLHEHIQHIIARFTGLQVVLHITWVYVIAIANTPEQKLYDKYLENMRIRKDCSTSV